MSYQREYSKGNVVRISRLLTSDRLFKGGSLPVARAPAVDDVGTIIHVYADAESEPLYVVQSIVQSGALARSTIWTAEFIAAELELVSSH